jgi:hypothetical protein
VTNVKNVKRRTTRGFMVLGAATALVLAGCGGDDGGSADEFCELADEADKASDDFGRALSANADPDEVEDAVNDLVDRAKAAADAAPDEIKDDVETLVEGTERFQQLFEDNDYDIEKIATDPDFQELSSDEDFNQAGENIEQFQEDECGKEASDETDDTAASDTTEATDETDATDATDDTVDTTVPDTDATIATTSPDTSISIPDSLPDSIPDVAIPREQLFDTYKRLFPKLNDDQVGCLTDKVIELLKSGGDISEINSMVFDFLSDCNINPADLS